MRSAIALILVLLALGTPAYAAAGDDDLYQSTVFVTGQGEQNRLHGFAQAFAEVLVKVSGDPRVRADRRVPPLQAEAARFVAGFSYRDRMAGIPVHDEQGTRERPFDLTIRFDPGKIDAALRSFGRTPWLPPRPKLAVLLWVRDVTHGYVLAADGESGLGERLSLAAVAAKHGIVLRLPLAQLVARERLDAASIGRLTPEQRQSLARAAGGDVLLSGTLVWREKDRGWEARWRLTWDGRPYRWQLAGVSFDDAFRNAFDRAVAILSGHAS